MKKAEVTPNHHAIAVELLNREYGPSNHPADPGRNFTVCFRTTSHAHQVRELSQAIADAEARGEARAVATWIPCGNPDKYPTVGDRVLCMSNCDDHLILDYAGAGDFADPEDDQVTFAVTHWQPLPKRPRTSRQAFDARTLRAIARRLRKRGRELDQKNKRNKALIGESPSMVRVGRARECDLQADNLLSEARRIERKAAK